MKLKILSNLLRQNRWLQFILINLFVLIAYWAVAEATGALFSVYELLPAAIWPAAAIAFVSVWYWGRRAWLGVFIGAVFANWLYSPVQPPLWAAMVIAFGSLSAVVIANYLIKRYCGQKAPFNQLNSVLVFLSVGGILQALIAASIGVTAVYFSVGSADGTWFTTWFKWVVADSAGVLLLAPALMVWLRPPNSVQKVTSSWELLLVFLLLTLFVFGIYWWASASTYAIYALPFLLIGPLAWAALRFSIQSTVLLLLWKELLAFSGTLLGYGVLNASGDLYPIGTLGVMLVSTAVGVHVVNALVAELRIQQQILKVNNEALEMRVTERTANLVASEARMRLLASTDELTGIANRRYFWNRFEKELNSAHQQNKTLYLAMIDIDHFKMVNDTYGHLAGDEALKILANLMRECFDHSHFIGRLGGEEFGVMMSNLEPLEAYKKLDDFRHKLSEVIFKFNGKKLSKITISIGLSSRQSEDTTDVMFARADQALYAAKNDGRNCIRQG